MSTNKNDYVKIRQFPGDIPRRMKINLFEGNVEGVEHDRSGCIDLDIDIPKTCKKYKKNHVQQAKKRERSADKKSLREYKGETDEQR